MRSRLRSILSVTAVACISVVSLGMGVGNARPGSPPVSAVLTVGQHPWQQTDGDATLSRANLTESMLTRRTIRHAVFVRKLATPPAVPPDDFIDVHCKNLVSSPLLVGSRVYDAAEGRLDMYNVHTGHERWSEGADPLAGDDGLTSINTMAVGGGLLVASLADCESNGDPTGRLIAFDPTTGALVWRRFIPDFLYSSELIESGPFVLSIGESAVGGGQEIGLFRLGDGSEVWSKTPGCNPDAFGRPAMIVHGLVIYDTCTNSLQPPFEQLTALDLSSGNVVWTQDGSWLTTRGSNAGASGHVYAQLEPGPGQIATGPVQDLNATTGAIRFSLAGATNVLAVDNDRVYAQCGTTHICSYNEKTGARLWRRVDASTLASEAHGVLYLADGKALTTTTGNVIARLWRRTATDIAVGEGRIATVIGTTLRLYGLTGR
jgi:outer membrane protein assembly factor BamB